MRKRMVVLAWLAVMPATTGAQVDQQALDPEYCARRDADPRKCTLYDGTPPRRGVLPEPAAIPPGTPVPDAEYCSRRDADPRKCVIYNGPPPDPILRQQPVIPQPAPQQPAPPAAPISPAPGLQPAPGSPASIPVAPSSAGGTSSGPAAVPLKTR